MPIPFAAAFILNMAANLALSRMKAKQQENFARRQNLVSQFVGDLYTPPETTTSILDLAGVAKNLYDLRQNFGKDYSQLSPYSHSSWYRNQPYLEE